MPARDAARVLYIYTPYALKAYTAWMDRTLIWSIRRGVRDTGRGLAIAGLVLIARGALRKMNITGGSLNDALSSVSGDTTSVTARRGQVDAGQHQLSASGASAYGAIAYVQAVCQRLHGSGCEAI